MSQPTPARAYALPTIHLNGTGAQSLFDEYHAVWLAVEKAAETLQNATCNDRDFYPQAPGAYDQARAERDEAFRKLRDVQVYVESWLKRASDHL
jgi:hypothetical protein